MRDLTQAELAQAAGIPAESLSGLEAREHPASHRAVARIAGALGVDVGEIDPGSDRARPAPPAQSAGRDRVAARRAPAGTAPVRPGSGRSRARSAGHLGCPGNSHAPFSGYVFRLPYANGYLPFLVGVISLPDRVVEEFRADAETVPFTGSPAFSVMAVDIRHGPLVKSWGIEEPLPDRAV